MFSVAFNFPIESKEQNFFLQQKPDETVLFHLHICHLFWPGGRYGCKK